MKHQSESLYSASSTGGLKVGLVYSAYPHSSDIEDARLGPFGRNWFSRYSARVTLDRQNTASLNRADGRTFEFRLTIAGGPYVTDADTTDQLERLYGGSTAIGWRYTVSSNDDVELYDVLGRLLSITSRSELVTRLSYSNGQGGILFGTGGGPNGFTAPSCQVAHPVPAGTVLPAGLLLCATDAFGRQVHFQYIDPATGRLDALDRVHRMLDPAGEEYLFEYDGPTGPSAANNLTKVTFPDGDYRTYHYAEAAFINNGTACPGDGLPNALTGITDENADRYATWTYDCQGRATTSQHAGGVDLFTLSYAAGSTTVVDPLGTSRTIAVQRRLGVAKPDSTTQPDVSGTGSASNALTYDANGNVASRTDWNGNRTNYTYHLPRNLEASRTEGLTSAGASTPQTRTTTTAWHAAFRLPTSIAEPLKITTNVYDANGSACGARGALCSRTEQATNDADGSQGLSATPVGTARTWTYTYNANGNLLTVNGPRTDVSDVTTYTYYGNNDADLAKRGQVATITNAASQVTSITAYNPHGQPTTIVDVNGVTTTLAYDERLHLTSRSTAGETTTYDYDGVGQLTKVTLPDGSYLSYTYDGAHRLTAIEDNAGNRIAYTLDNMGNRTQEQVLDPSSALAQTRTRVFNSLNRLYRELGALSQTTEYAYDNQGNVASVKDPLNHITFNQFDALNRLKQVTDPGSGVTQYAYSGQDRLVQVTDPRSLVTGYTVDGLGNLTQQVSPDTGTTANTYDAAGNLLTQTDAKSQTTTYTYDALNRVTLITFHDGSKQEYAYDSTSGGNYGIGRLTGISERDPSNNITAQTAYTYDQKGRLLTDIRTIAGIAYITAYHYDNYGRRDRITYPSGRTVDYTFDSRGRIAGATSTPNGGSQQTLASSITYHPFGGLKSFTFGNGQTYQRTYDQDGRISSYTLGGVGYTVGYDDASRIVSISETLNPTNVNTYGYDNLNQLTSADTPGTDYGYTYDAVGNRLTRIAGSSTDTYAYSTTSNRIASITPPSGPIRSFTFDNNGSTTADGNNTYTYDVRGRMVSSTSTVGATNYQVNALGQRIRKTNSIADQVFHYDDKGHLIAETTAAGALVKEYAWIGDAPVAVMSGGAAYHYIHVDHLNTPRLVADAVGMTVWQWDQQEPFGSNWANENPGGAGIFDMPLRFPGQHFDKETNLTYNFFRDYDSAIGRYVQSDPIGLAGGINTYAYVGSNPLSNRDPLGLSSHGCGAGPLYRGIPNLWFRKCCDAHDACYENCKDLPPKSQCDSTFCGCVFSKCTGWANSAACRALAGSYCAAGTQSEQSQRSFDESREKCKRTPLVCATAGQS